MKFPHVLGAGIAVAAASLALAGCAAGEPAADSSSAASSTEAAIPAPETNEQMKAEGADGLSATTYYYYEAMSYALQTAKTDDMLAVTQDCAECEKAAGAIAHVYDDEGTIEGGQPKPQDVVAVGKADQDGQLSAVVPYMEDAKKVLDKDGEVVEETEWDAEGTTYTVTGTYDDGAWKITSLKHTPDASAPEEE